MVKIFFLMYDALPPFRPDVRVLFGNELPKIGVHSDLVGQYSLGNNSSPKWGGGSIFTQGQQRKGLIGEFVRPFQDFFGMLRYLNKDHQIIQVRDKIRTGVLAWIVARLTKRKFVYWMSYPFADGFVERARDVGRSKGWVICFANHARAALAVRVYYKFLVHCVDHLFVQSDQMLEMMHTVHAVPRSRMTAVPMGVDAKWLKRDRVAVAGTRPSMLNGRRVVAYMGTMARVRQPDFLLRVLEAVRLHDPSVMLLLIGDAPSADEQEWLRKEIAASPAASFVHLTGWLPTDEAQRWLANADLGLSPIPRGALLDAGSPTKAIEYLALGLPCVGNENPDQRSVLESSGGGMCVPMSIDAFAAASLKLLLDNELALQMGLAGQQWVGANRSYPTIAPIVARVYSDLLERQ